MKKALALSLLVAGLAGCSSTIVPDEKTVEASFHRTNVGPITVSYREEDLPAVEALVLARELASVHAAVASELASPSSSATHTRIVPPSAEIVLYRDASWGQERWLVTHARILESPVGLRVRIPCALLNDEQEGSTIAARIRGTVAHEIAEATVLSNVRILDPYLRWMHDGIAESIEYRVLQRIDARAGAEVVERYRRYAREATLRGWRWLDLTRWRQLSDFIVHSESVFPKGSPALSLTDVPGSLKRLAAERLGAEDERDVYVSALIPLWDTLGTMLGDSLVKEQMPRGIGEADLHTPDGQFLCYDAAFCFFLELERAHPGTTARLVADMSARHEAVLTGGDVLKLLETSTGEPLRARLERFTVARIERILELEPSH